MPTTPNFNLPYPSLTDAPNGPSQLQALAAATDTAMAGQTPSGHKAFWLFCNTVTTDGSGYVTITHGAGFTPTVATATPSSPISGSVTSAIFGMAMADTFTSTTVRVRCFFANGTQIASATVSFSLFLGQ